MADMITEKVKDFLAAHRVARMATVDGRGTPHVIPICYVYDGTYFYSAVDQKPKKVPATKIRRIRNIEGNPKVAIVVDDYSDDWSQLAYVLVFGVAEILYDGAEHKTAIGLLRLKYPQYLGMSLEERPVIKVVPTNTRAWVGLRHK